MERYWVANGILASNECGGLVKYDDAQRALDAEREKVKRLSTCGTDHSTPWWQVKCEDLEAQLATLRQLVEALPVVDGRMDVECGACYYIRSFVAGQYGIVCGLMTEQSTAMAIKALLEYRATLAAQDAPHPSGPAAQPQRGDMMAEQRCEGGMRCVIQTE